MVYGLWTAPPSLITMRRSWTVGVDFGGTNVKVGLVDARGRVVRTQRLSSTAVSTPAAFVDETSRVAVVLAHSVGIAASQLRGIGIGAPGPVDVKRGVIHALVNIPGWCEVPLARQVERRVHCRCLIDNDANLFSLGEWRFGAGRGARALVGLTLGTGVGGGFVCDGAVFRGVSGAAGELGHMVVDPQGPRCGCGQRGCLEAHVGAAAIIRLGRRALHRNALSPALIAQAAERGNAAARGVWRQMGRWLGIGVANLLNILNPDRIVIGGGVSRAWRWFAPTLIAQVQSQAMGVSARSVRIVRARLGDTAGIVGAAVLVWGKTGGEGQGARA